MMKIVIEPCAACSAVMSISDARVEDGFDTGVVEATCPNCGYQVVILVEVQHG